MRQLSAPEQRLRSPCATLLVAFALGAPSALAFEVVSLETRVTDGSYRVMLDVLIDAPAEQVARVLTDYAGYIALDPRIRKSEVIGATPAGDLLVHTRIVACAAFFCRNVARVEQVRRLEGRLLADVVPERSDLRWGWARTDWSDEDGRTRVRYTAEFQPDFWVPAVVARSYASTTLKESVLQLFRNVEERSRVQ
jgi:hypothetical protein